MEYQITGRVAEVYPVNRISERFRKREFVIEHKDSSSKQVYVDYIKFQLTQDRCEIIDESWLRQDVTVTFNIRGNRWEKNGVANYITNLNALSVTRGIAVAENGQQAIVNPQLEDAPSPSPELDDLPF
ncbi:MAG TPA: DUF3127 domain-containing protein [Bacteroidales bacterium]|jgi:hypothetical protein|nr:DUF3127 domain-containing protein [Bacteroidales bacterium]MDI9534026.1 DUF3127 domain-containing protein [Bacteroidota bacterium]MBP7037126.1 DUF3127 domain-containing protein [Bacteroidales bacterium]MBP8710301.1 DUF3127 domain-containing protein [Bacteroidales bacterium]MZQ80379.1 DUF3127 domain-containing protein [Bacteroidales bacterium]